MKILTLKMAKNDSSTQKQRGWVSRLLSTRLTLAGIALVAVIAVVWMLVYATRNDSMSITKSDRINITPMQIRSIERIGEWEFLSIADEELIDTVRRGIFSDDQLANIYYGILRIGIDLGKAPQGWLQARGDSVVAVLPPVQLLDENFIDETRTKPFLQEGNWTQSDHAALYNKARRTMKSRCLTPSVWRSAEHNAATQMTNLLRAMGFNNIRVVTSHEEAKK